MADGLTIRITSDLPTARSIYLFQEPAGFFVRSGGGGRVYGNCLLSGVVGGQGELTITIGRGAHAAIQEAMPSPEPGRDFRRLDAV